MKKTNRNQEDLALLKQIAAGDEQAFEELYDVYHVSLYNYLLRLTHAVNISENLLQETYLTIWKAAQGFRAEAQVKNWMYSIAHHKAVSWLRKTRKDNRPREVPLTYEHVQEYQTVDPEEVVLQNDRGDALQEALDYLTPKHRAVIELAYVHEFSYEEIARIVDCPLGTVKSRINYAAQQLGGVLKKLT
jgi:RNA polymerase sigma-70 factor (ECF subfamily)